MWRQRIRVTILKWVEECKDVSEAEDEMCEKSDGLRKARCIPVFSIVFFSVSFVFLLSVIWHLSNYQEKRMFHIAARIFFFFDVLNLFYTFSRLLKKF